MIRAMRDRTDGGAESLGRPASPKGYAYDDRVCDDYDYGYCCGYDCGYDDDCCQLLSLLLDVPSFRAGSQGGPPSAPPQRGASPGGPSPGAHSRKGARGSPSPRKGARILELLLGLSWPVCLSESV